MSRWVGAGVEALVLLQGGLATVRAEQGLAAEVKLRGEEPSQRLPAWLAVRITAAGEGGPGSSGQPRPNRKRWSQLFKRQ